MKLDRKTKLILSIPLIIVIILNVIVISEGEKTPSSGAKRTGRG
jgi:hypothetical protein